MTAALQLVKTQLLNRGRPKKFTPETVQQVRNLVERGKSRDEIAEIIGVTIGTLQVTCSKLGNQFCGDRPLTWVLACCRDSAAVIRRMDPRINPVHGPRVGKRMRRRAYAVPEATTTEQARAGAPSAVGSHGKMHDGIPPAFAIRMQYKGQERSTVLPLDKEMIGQLAIEAEIRGMRIGELVAALIRAIVKKDLFHLTRDTAYTHMHSSSGLLAGRVGDTPSDPSTLVKIFETASSVN